MTDQDLIAVLLQALKACVAEYGAAQAADEGDDPVIASAKAAIAEAEGSA